MAIYRAGFIGAGNMGGALAIAACKTTDSKSIALADNDKQKAQTLADSCNCVAADNATVASNCEFIFLGVKPQVLPHLLDELAPFLAARTDRFVLVTMAAGISIKAVEEGVGGAYPVIRIMPNTPVAIGEGMVLYAQNDAVTTDDEQAFLRLMSASGCLDKLDEKLIDAGSAVSGCGPAFAYLFIEALADGGVECGLPRDKALRYAAQTILGAAEMVLCTGKHPAELKDAVCSPGGTTIAGVHALEQGAFRNDAMSAVAAAYRRTMELKK